MGATVWDARTGKELKNLAVGETCRVEFSPDNRWLLTRGGGYRLWHVDSWEPGPDLKDETSGSGWSAFSPDGKLLALTGPVCQVRLLETATGREIARLTVPEQSRVYPYCFSPDGSRLAALGAESQLTYLWDLRALRETLRRDFNLDWNAPAYAPVAAASPKSIRVLFAPDG
jgi:WD40 repeat protein